VFVPLLGYIVAVATAATTSSLGVASLRQDPAHPLGAILGGPQPLRSDEWLTQTPIELGVLALGHSSHSPLAQSPDLVFQIPSGQPFESAFFLETIPLRLGALLPDAQLFAATRALPLLVVLLTLPPLLRRFGASRPQSWLGVLLTVLAPTSLWWSFTPVRILAFASLGGYLLIAAHDRWSEEGGRFSRVIACLQAALAGIVIAQLTTYYVPWGLTVGVPVVVATVMWLLWSVPRRPGLLVLAIGGATGGLLLALTLWENQAALTAALDTVYPGSRRSGGAAVAPFQLFGAPGLFKSAGAVDAALPNASEIASAFLICLVWAGLLRGRLNRTVSSAQRAAQWGLTASVLVWVAWCTVSWGRLGEDLPVLNFVPAARAAQTVGYTSALVLILVLSRTSSVGVWRALPVAAVCGLVTAYGVSNLQSALPPLSTAEVWSASVAVIVLVWAVTAFPHSWAPVVAVGLALAWSGHSVNPINFGLGDLRDSASAHLLRDLGEEARANHTWIAADSPFVSAVLVANGAPSLTGYQVSGPDKQAWQQLDPSGTYEDEWNRGASFLRMDFIDSGATPRVTNPNPDVIQVSVDPCVLADSSLDVGYVISTQPLHRPCVRETSTFTWSGRTNHVYALVPARTR
jgi:hypothetical protein